MKRLRDPLLWLIALFLLMLAGLPHSQAIFASLFPELPRPVYQQESFLAAGAGPFLAGGRVEPVCGGDWCRAPGLW